MKESMILIIKVLAITAIAGNAWAIHKSNKSYIKQKMKEHWKEQDRRRREYDED